MDFSIFAERVGKKIADNSPVILTAIGVTGAVGAVVLTGKASFKAAEILAEERVRIENGLVTSRDLGVETDLLMDNRAKFDLVWKEYIPAAVIGTLAVAAMVGANHIGMKRAAAMASAYSLLQQGYHEYKEKVLETVGKNKEEQVRVKVAQEKIERTPFPKDREAYFLAPGNDLWFDARTGRWFRSDMETVRAAVNDLNEIILRVGHASVSDFYEMIGLDTTSDSDELGWTTDGMLDVGYTAVVTKHGPAMSMEFNSIPVREFYRFG